MSWFKKLMPTVRTEAAQKKGVPEGVWTKCEKCQAVLYQAELARNLKVCPKCGQHQRLTSAERLAQFLDEGSGRIFADDVTATDWLKFKDSKKYKDRISAAEKKCGENEALRVEQGRLFGMDVVACAFEFSFIGGSMGAAVGERFVQGVEKAIELNAPFICFSTSGGARMQEGLTSLMQMAKTSAALAKLAEKGLPFISVLCDPTMGGVSASLSMLGDIIIAEPGALIGFAGPRVIKETVRETLPEGFQRSEFLLEHGAIDMVVSRGKIRQTVARLLASMCHTKVMLVDDEAL